METKQERQGFRAGDVATMALGHFMHDIFGSFLSPVLPLLIEKHSLSYTMAGFLQIAQRAPSLLNPIVGFIADRKGMRFLVMAGPAVTASAMGLLGVAPSYTAVLLLLTMGGLSSAVFHVPAPVLVRDAAGDLRGRGMSFFMLGGELARSVGPLIILAGISVWGFEGTFRLIPLGFGASAFLYFRLSKFPPAPERHGSGEGGKRSGTLDSLKGAWKFLLLIMGLVLTRQLVASALTSFLPVYMKTRGSTLWVAGGALSILEFSGAAGTLASGWISDIIGRKNMLLMIAIAGPLLMGIFLLVSGVVVVPIIVLLGFVVLSTQPVMLALVQDMAKDHPSMFNGIYVSMSFSGGAAVSLLVGILGDALGIRTALALCAFFSLGAIPLVLKLPGKGKTDI